MQVGCIEGQGHALEQQAPYHFSIGRRFRASDRRRAHLREARAAAVSARTLFERIGSDPLCGRIDGLLRQIGAGD